MFLTRSGEGQEWPVIISKLTSPPSEECFGWSFPPLAKFQNHSFQSIPVLLPSTGECWEPYIFFIETYQPELVLGQNSSKFFFQCWYGFFRSQTSLVVQRVTVHKLKKQVKYQLCFVKSLYDAWLSAVYLLDYEQSLFFSVVRRAKREKRKWPRAWLMARDGRGLFFLLGLPPSFRASRGFAAPARVHCSH